MKASYFFLVLALCALVSTTSAKYAPPPIVKKVAVPVVYKKAPVYTPPPAYGKKVIVPHFKKG